MSGKIDVKPTSTVPNQYTDIALTNQYTDIALTNLFNAHLSLLNSERHVIWLRYQSMLVANSIVVGLLARLDELKTMPVVLGSIFGLALCLAWLVSLWSGYNLFFKLHKEALRFEWSYDPSANPCATGESYRSSDWIRYSAIFVIFLFIAAYLVLIGYNSCG